jgi:hypothetical protein
MAISQLSASSLISEYVNRKIRCGKRVYFQSLAVDEHLKQLREKKKPARAEQQQKKTDGRCGCYAYRIKIEQNENKY